MELNDVTWRTSSYSGSNGSCVEVSSGRAVRVRDSKDRAGPGLAFSPTEWQDFIDQVKAGVFDRMSVVRA